MATEEQAAAATARFRAAVEAHDVDATVECFAPRVVMHSPLTSTMRFEGHDEVRDLLPHVYASIHEIRYTDDVGDARTRALFYTARIGKVDVEEATRVRLDDDALIADITLYFRPLPGLTALMADLGPRLAKEQGPAKGVVTAAMTKPLAGVTRTGDRLAAKLVRPGTR